MKKKDLLKKKLAILSLAGSLAFTGCTGKKKEEARKNNIYVTCDTHSNPEIYDRWTDNLMGLKNTADEDFYGEKLNYNYFIDNTNISKEELADRYKNANENPTLPVATFARLVDEKTITDKVDATDGKRAMTTGTFRSAIQIVMCPDMLKNMKIPLSCLDFEINVKKLVSLEGDTFYDVKSIVMFNDNIRYYMSSMKVYPGVTMECESLFQLFPDGKFVEISRNQTGLGCEDENIASTNFNNKVPVVLQVEDTVFNGMNGDYKEAYLKEAADTYKGTNDFYSSENKGTDFSQYKKVLIKED